MHINSISKYNFIYKTTSIRSGKFYVGRHSTNDLNDGYKGSGKWINSIKNKNILKTEILEHVRPDVLLLVEEEYIEKYFDYLLNMNYHKSSIGFASGDLNPAKTKKERKRRSDHSWMKTEEGRKWFSENNPSKKDFVKELRKLQAAKELAAGTHNFLNKELQEINLARFINMIKTNNPMHHSEIRKKVSRNTKSQALEQRGSFAKKSCKYCEKKFRILDLSRHENKCLNESFLKSFVL